MDVSTDATYEGPRVRRAIRGLVVFLVIVTIVLSLLRSLTSASPYVELGSGPVVNLAHGSSSQISLTTVDAVRLSWGGYFLAKALGKGDNIALYSTTDTPLLDAANVQAMKAAKQDAALVAVYAVTGKTPMRYTGARVEYVLPGLPAQRDGILPGDVIITVNGIRPKSIKGVGTLLQSTHGRSVTLGILRGEELLSLTTTPRLHTGSWKIGVGIIPLEQISWKSLPRPLATGPIVGPSGGLMFTLTYINKLSTGRLSSVPLAGTGTIDESGGVGAIGGVGYKVRGAIASGAKVFFVPSANAHQARQVAAGHIKVVSVNSVGDALHWLCTHGATSSVCHKTGLYHRLNVLLRTP
jgi:PDZ domain-containing secreted protein